MPFVVCISLTTSSALIGGKCTTWPCNILAWHTAAWLTFRMLNTRTTFQTNDRSLVAIYLSNINPLSNIKPWSNINPLSHINPLSNIKMFHTSTLYQTLLNEYREPRASILQFCGSCTLICTFSFRNSIFCDKNPTNSMINVRENFITYNFRRCSSAVRTPLRSAGGIHVHHDMIALDAKRQQLVWDCSWINHISALYPQTCFTYKCKWVSALNSKRCYSSHLAVIAYNMHGCQGPYTKAASTHSEVLPFNIWKVFRKTTLSMANYLQLIQGTNGCNWYCNYLLLRY